MDERQKADGILEFYRRVSAVQAQIIETQAEVMRAVAGVMAEVVRGDGRIFTFGTGHSHMLCEESYYRAGGIAAATPMFTPPIFMLHESARMSSQMERMPEIAEPILDEYEPQSGELLIVYADSGVNGLPVQMAISARERGVIVVGVCSLKYTQIAPLSKVGKRLPEVVDYVIDNCGEPGDALVELPGVTWRVAASSTIAGALIWNCLLTEMCFRLQGEGVEPPVFASFNMPGAAQHNQVILQKWSKINQHLPDRNIKVKR